MIINQLYDYVYNGGYVGGWGWLEIGGNMDNMLQGLNYIRNYYSGVYGIIYVQIY